MLPYQRNAYLYLLGAGRMPRQNLTCVFQEMQGGGGITPSLRSTMEQMSYFYLLSLR